MNWNVEWRPTVSHDAQLIRERIWSADPDIICLTETYQDFLDRPGHVVTSASDYGYPIKEGRRKVLLWSKRPWASVDAVGAPELPPGRFIRARTSAGVGPLDVIGVCIPWFGAHVTTGHRNRQRWQDHLSYLSGLNQVLSGKLSRLIMLGDYNQKMPRTMAPQSVYDALEAAVLSKLQTPTGGRLGPDGNQVIDHLSHSRDFACVSVSTLSNLNPEGGQISDHVGVHIVLTKLASVASLRPSLERATF